MKKRIISVLVFILLIGSILLFFILNDNFKKGIGGKVIEDLRQECKDNEIMYNLYPTKISIVNEETGHYLGYVNYWEWYYMGDNFWRAKYAAWEMESFDGGLTWNCPEVVKDGRTEKEYVWAGPIKDISMNPFTTFIPISYAEESNFPLESCGWSNEQGVEQMCQLWFDVGNSVIYLGDENWNLHSNPVVGYYGTPDQDDFLIQNGYKSQNRRYDEIYHPLPVKIDENSNEIHLYFGGWKGENNENFPICPEESNDNLDYMIRQNAGYKYCNCFHTWEQSGAGWWDETPYDMCTGDKIYYATNRYNFDPYDFRAYAGDATNPNDNDIAGPFSAWASEEWQPILWAEGIRNKCSHEVCNDVIAVQDGGAAIKIPDGRIVLYFTLYRDIDKFPREKDRGGIITVATSDDGIHFLNNPDKIKPLEANWPTGQYGYSWDSFGAQYDPKLNKIVMIANLYTNLDSKATTPYRLLIDPSNPYVVESITRINSLKYCTDSDGGKNYKVKGTVTDNTRTYEDSCIGSFYIKEYYCQDNKMKTSYMVCPKFGLRYRCVDGKCIMLGPTPTPEPEV